MGGVGQARGDENGLGNSSIPTMVFVCFRRTGSEATQCEAGQGWLEPGLKRNDL